MSAHKYVKARSGRVRVGGTITPSQQRIISLGSRTISRPGARKRHLEDEQQLQEYKHCMSTLLLVTVDQEVCSPGSGNPSCSGSDRARSVL